MKTIDGICSLSLIMCVFLQACGSGSHNAGADSAVLIAPPTDSSADALAWADSIADGMTLEQMAGQLFLPAVFADDSPASLKALASYAADTHVGGVVLLRGEVKAARAVADTLSHLLSAPPFIAIDAEWGLAMRLENTPKFPKNGNISYNAEETALYDYGNEIARECRTVGINMVLGPVLDVLDSGEAPGASAVIGNRSFGSDPERVAKLGVAYARGLEDGGVLSVAKHFPGHGAADADSHKRLPVVKKDKAALEKSDLLPFRGYIDNGLSCIMLGHLNVPALDNRNIPVSVSEKVIDGLLRKKMKFSGLILTDAMNMAAAGNFSGADAILAGADIVIAPADTHAEVTRLVSCVKNGDLNYESLRRKVIKILFFKYFLASPSAFADLISSPEYQRVATFLQ